MKCKVCGNNRANQSYEVKEKMFGYGDTFCYFQCSKCNCLQIKDIPSNISKYYPDEYYSYQGSSDLNKVQKFFMRRRDKYALYNKGFIGRCLYTKYPSQKMRCLRLLPISKDSKILDVGCGAGRLLYSLRELGIKNLLGADPFNKQDIEYNNGLRIQKTDLHGVSGNWDIVMFHYSFEHLVDQLGTLKTVSKLLTSDGHCMMRIPISSSFAWNHYKVNWVQLDAPRHFFLHSIESINILADQAGLDLYKLVHDSTYFQFWGSEQYVNEIPLVDKRSYSQNPKNSLFSKKDIADFTKRAHELNATEQGDQATFYFKPKRKKPSV